MTTGIHVEIAVENPSACQVAPHSEESGTVTSVTKSPRPGGDTGVVEEFTLTTGSKRVELDGGTAVTDDNVKQLFTAGPKEIFRFERSPQGCACEQVERLGCPVREVNAVDGTLYLRFIADGHDRLQETLEQLTDRYDQLRVNRLLHSKDPSETEQLALVDIGALTERQREVLRTAHEMGYFDHPKSASAADIATRLGIAPSTFTEHLSAAQRNLLAEILDR